MMDRARKTTCHRRGSALVLLSLASILLALPLGAQDPSTCTLQAPSVVGPDVVRPGEVYSLSWTRILKGLLGKSDFYTVERATDPAFRQNVVRVKTTRTSTALPAAPSGVSALYHRVFVQAACPSGATSTPVASAVYPVKVTTACDAPRALEAPVITPENPPALTTYVVTWTAPLLPTTDASSSRVRYRLRRIEPTRTTESLLDATSAVFVDGMGEFAYQVRAEAACGAVGPWSPLRKTLIGPAQAGALALVSEPRPLFTGGLSPEAPVVTMAVRNGGTEPLSVETAAPEGVVVTPARFSAAPFQAVGVSVSLPGAPPAEAAAHVQVEFRSTAGTLVVPLDAAQPLVRGEKAALFAGGDVWIGEGGDPVTVTLVNPGTQPSAVLGSVRPDWIVVEDPSGLAWDRPLAALEQRVLSVRADRSRRRAETGTEVGTITVQTYGFPDEPQTLTVTDDGPALVLTDATGTAGPSAIPSRTRLLFASLPNALDASGTGRYTADLWLTNIDALSPIPVTLTLTPAGETAGTASGRRTELVLAPGETRRYANIVGKMLGRDGTASLEVASPATTLSATVIAASTPIGPAPALRAFSSLRGQSSVAPFASSGQYGFEMRPTAPGEGVSATDPEFVVSGLSHAARRRTNLILAETSGKATDVLIEPFQQNGDPVMAGVVPFELPVQIALTVPANGSLQVNDADLFPDGVSGGAPYARVSFQGSTRQGSVVPFATVIDNGTQDASLRVGVSTRALSPVASQDVNAASVRPLGSSQLPFGGDPAPLLVPVAHADGAPLATGKRPVWKTRVTFTNVNLDEQRVVKLTFLDQSGNTPILPPLPVALAPRTSFSFEDIVKEFFLLPDGLSAWGGVYIGNTQRADGTWVDGWADVDVQTETYTTDPENAASGDYMTGMEGFSYLHGYSSFQSNLATVQFEGAESSARFRTNLILEEVGGAAVDVAVAAYLPGSFVPLAIGYVRLQPLEYVSRELFGDVLGLDRTGLVDARIVVRQVAGDGVFMAFASKIDKATGDPANIFLRPASAGTGR